MPLRTHNVDIVALDVSVLLLFADLQTVAMFGIAGSAVSCFLYPPCYICYSLSLNLVQ